MSVLLDICGVEVPEQGYNFIQIKYPSKQNTIRAYITQKTRLS